MIAFTLVPNLPITAKLDSRFFDPQLQILVQEIGNSVKDAVSRFEGRFERGNSRAIDGIVEVIQVGSHFIDFDRIDEWMLRLEE